MIIGVDAGTSVTKACAFGDDGTLLGVESRRTRVTSPAPGHFEQDSDEVAESVAAVVGAVAARFGAPELIGITGQGDGVWLVDARGRQVRPAIIWMDGRAAPIVERWLADGTCAAVFERNAGAPFPGSPGPILAWLAEREPAALDAAHTAAYCKDVVMQRLTGIRATDVSDASLPFLDPHTRDYDADVLGLLGLADRGALLAPVSRPYGAVGELEADGARLTGLAAGTPVCAGPYDIVATTTGAGVTEPGDGLLIIGTTLVCEVVADRFAAGGELAGQTLNTWRTGRWINAMPAMVGTASLDWVTDLTGADPTELDGLLAGGAPGAGGVEALPFFSPAGERAPFLDPDARGALEGLTVQTTRADVVRAICESIAYAARHCFEAAGLTGRIVVCGGGAASSEWLRIFAAVLGRPLYLARQPEVGARGAAMSALLATGREHDVERWSRPTGSCEPADELMDFYQEGYVRYLRRVDRARAARA
jgi:erythritol kinase